MYQGFLAFIVFILCIYSSDSKYQDDSDEVSKVKPTEPSVNSFEDNLADKGTEDEDEEELPEGFELLDGVIVDTTNLMIQEATDAGTVYKMYDTRSQVNGEIKYKRSSREAGWHFVMFEDPLEDSGTGHLILLQKLLGFSIESNKTSNKREVRLYEIFHVDLGNDFTDEIFEGTETDNEDSIETRDKRQQISGELDPNDNAELVSSQLQNKNVDDKIVETQYQQGAADSSDVIESTTETKSDS